MDILEKLKEIVTYYNSTRQTGHTTTMLIGGVYAGEKCLIVTHSDMMGIELQRMTEQKLNTISINSPTFLRGYNKPLLFDNEALIVLFKKAIDEIEMSKKSSPTNTEEQLCKEIVNKNEEIERLKEKLHIIKSVVNL